MTTAEELVSRAASRMQRKTMGNVVRQIALGDGTYHGKAAVAAHSSADQPWADSVVDDASQFLAIIERGAVLLSAGFFRVPLRTRVTAQLTRPTAYRVTPGQPRPVSSITFSNLTLQPASVGSLVVLTDELLRSTSPQAESGITRQLTSAVISSANTMLLDPDITGSILDGATPIASSGTDPDALVADVAKLLAVGDQPVLIASLPWAVRIAAALRGADRLFPLLIAPEAGNFVIAVDRFAVAVAWGEVTVAKSEAATLQMLDNPTNTPMGATVATTLVSMFQTNAVAVRAELAANWQVIRADGIKYVDYSPISP